MKKTIILVLALSVQGCAQRALVKDWKSSRGYTDRDIEIIQPHLEEYTRVMAASSSFGGPFATATNTAASEQRMRNIVCNCFKKLGDKCTKRPIDLKGTDLDLWAKSNAAEYALRGAHSDANLLGMSESKVDPAECP